MNRRSLFKLIAVLLPLPWLTPKPAAQSKAAVRLPGNKIYHAVVVEIWPPPAIMRGPCSMHIEVDGAPCAWDRASDPYASQMRAVLTPPVIGRTVRISMDFQPSTQSRLYSCHFECKALS